MQNNFNSEQRLERKYILSPEQVISFDQLIQLNPAHFRPTYRPRYINNIYFDTADFTHFRENIAGVSPRRKVRVRWYGAFSSERDTSFEIKSKVGEVVTKYASKINFSGTESFEQIAAQIKSKDNKDEVAEILSVRSSPYRPVLVNRYLRRYYVSASGKVRLTIDMELFFEKADTQLQFPRQRAPQTIVELKYSLADESQAATVASQFPFRLSKSSKYQQGVSLCYPHMVIL